MRKEKALIRLLGGLVELVAEEAARNPKFAARADALLADVPERRPAGKRSAPADQPRDLPKDVPDIYTEWNRRGEQEFRVWLRAQPIPTLRAVIRAQDLDSTSRTPKWKEAEKLADFISDGVRARLARGSAFMTRREETAPESHGRVTGKEGPDGSQRPS